MVEGWGCKIVSTKGCLGLLPKQDGENPSFTGGHKVCLTRKFSQADQGGKFLRSEGLNTKQQKVSDLKEVRNSRRSKRA